MICRNVKSNLPDLLLDPQSVAPEIRAHVENCADCGKELRELQTTMGLMDVWEAPEVSPFFDARMAALLREEQQAPQAGWLERMRARWMFGNSMHLRPLAAAALAVMIAAGGGLYVGLSGNQVKPVQAASPVITDLQSLDENQQVFQELNSMDQQNSGDDGGSGPGSL
jgi:anti-sigma factor RsiW